MYASDPAPLSAAEPVDRTERPPTAPPSSIFARIGNTPLLRLDRVVTTAAPGAKLWGKAEMFNPTGSVKDRTAWGIVQDALAKKRLPQRRVLLDASSGNTGVAYAFLGARLGLGITICVPRNASPDRLRRMRAYGAEVILTDPTEGTDGAQQEASRLASVRPERFYYADQYNNPANVGIHYATTGPEVWRQTRGRLTHLVAGVGTGGTISGIGRFLKEREASIRVIGVEPDGPVHGIEGLKHIPTARRPSTYEAHLVDETRRVRTEDAEEIARRLAREEGLLVGTSAGAAVVVARDVVESVPEAVVVTILPDGGDRHYYHLPAEEAP